MSLQPLIVFSGRVNTILPLETSPRPASSCCPTVLLLSAQRPTDVSFVVGSVVCWLLPFWELLLAWWLPPPWAVPPHPARSAAIVLAASNMSVLRVIATP